MKVIRVFDPAMCCATGICGPTVDPKLVRFSADLQWLEARGVSVTRYNLAQEPAAFVAAPAVRAALEAQGEAALPLIEVDGIVLSTGRYASREELALWAGVPLPAPSIYTEAVAELVAIGASIAANCESCFKYHFDQARKLGVSREDMLRAVVTAQNVKDAPAQKILALAKRFLEREPVEPAVPAAPSATEASAPRFTVQPAPASSPCCEPAPEPPAAKGCEGPSATSGSPFAIAPSPKPSCC